MNFTLRSTSNSSNDNERLTRKRQTTTPTTLNRFLSFNENKSSSAENRRRLLQSTPNLIELLEEDEDDIDDSQELCHECNQCSKVFASEYGLNHHINMHHPNQSILCSLCNITFRSHRSLKTHQQRRHSSNQTKLNNTKNSLLPNYNYISSYLVLPFSSEQFPIMAKNACEQQRLPLGLLSSKLYQCHFCFISFPCIRTLKYHLLNQHEQYEYKICQDILSNLIDNVEYQLRTVNNNNDNDDLASIKLNLSKQASQFGLVNKQLATKLRSTKIEQGKLIYPRCQHESRTCANLCLNYLSSYSKLVQNYPYTIPTIPKGNPFAQGSILSIVPSSINNNNNNNSNNSSSNNDTNLSNESNNGRQKRKSIKQTDDASSSPQSKRKVPANSTTTTTSSKPNRTNTNNRINGNKQQNEQTTKTNETKSVTTEQSPFTLSVSPASAIPRKILPKDNYMRSSSMSSNSSTSTRSSMTKSSSSTTNLTAQTTTNSQRTFKRSLSPSITIPLEKSSQKRRRARDQKPAMTSSSSATVIRIDDDDDNDDIEQENDDEEDNNGDDIDDDDDVVPIKFEQEPKQRRQTKQRQASSGSIEYVQTLNNDQQLNNIENLKSKSKVNDEEVIICRSPPSVKKVNSSPNKNHSKTSVNGTKKSNLPSSSNNDEHVRVRCKICGDILEGRSRFSQHVLTMHSHLLKKNISETKQHQTAVVR